MGSGEVHDDRLSGGRHVSRQVSVSLQQVGRHVSGPLSSDLSIHGAFRSTLFSQDGSCLYSGATDSLRVFGWEPDRCFDAVPVGWGRVSDLALCGQQLVCGSARLIL